MQKFLSYIIFSSLIYYRNAASPNNEDVICQTKRCHRSADHFKLSMNLSVDPCDDFYGYACGNYHNYKPLLPHTFSYSSFIEIEHKLIKEVREYLETNSSDEDPNAVKQARLFYASCKDTDSRNAKGLKPIENALKAVGLPVKPPLTSSSSLFDWQSVSVKMSLLTGKDFIVAVEVSPDATNRTINRISIGKPNEKAPLPEIRKRQFPNFVHDVVSKKRYKANDSADELATEYINLYMAYIKQVISSIYKHTNSKLSKKWEKKLDKSVSSLIFFMIFKETIQSKNYPNETVVPKLMTLRELQNFTDTIATQPDDSPVIDWKEYFSMIFEHADSDLDVDFSDENGTLLQVYNTEYLEQIVSFMSVQDNYMLKLAMWWDVVSLIAPYTTDQMTELKKSFTASLADSNTTDASDFCVRAVKDLMGLAISYKYGKHVHLYEKKQAVSDMIGKLMEAFKYIVSNSQWMDEQTKEATLNKANGMRTYVGFPNWISNASYLDEQYEGSVLLEGDFLGTIIGEIQRQKIQNLNSLNSINNITEDSAASDPLQVNAFYSPDDNAVTIPLAVLAFPFHGHDLEALNYGAIGSVLGHEITHGFDDTGRRFDLWGNVNQWWKQTTLKEYKKKSSCFIDSYSSFKMKLSQSDQTTEDDEVSKYGKSSSLELCDEECSQSETAIQVDAKRTLDENISDNGGLREAIYAYRKYVMDHGPEMRLPGFEHFTHEQLLILSFANIWCEHSTELSLESDLDDEHSPNAVRVWGVLTNLEEFEQIYKCPRGSPMNPDKEKCRIW